MLWNNMYTHKIQFFSGDSILISEKQAESIKEAITRGVEMIPIGNDLVNVKSISRIGTHHATNQIRKVEENILDIKLAEAGRFDLIDQKRKLIKEKTVNTIKRFNGNVVEKLKDGDPEAIRRYMNMPDRELAKIETGEDSIGNFYIGESGDKIYS